MSEDEVDKREAEGGKLLGSIGEIWNEGSEKF